MADTEKVVQIQVGTGDNARIVELVNNDKKIAELRAEYDSIISTLQSAISSLTTRIAELEEKMNAIDVEPSDNGDSTGSSNSMN